MTVQKRHVTCCPSCKSTHLHKNKQLGLYVCGKCKIRFPKSKLATREVSIRNIIPKHLKLNKVLLSSLSN